MIKIIHNNLIIDLCPKERYLKYLPHQQHFIEVKKYMKLINISNEKNP